MDDTSPKDLFLQSLERCVASDAFVNSFYERFMGKSEEVRAKFRFTDFKKQNAMLKHSLELCAGATVGDPEALRELNERAITHDRHHWNIDAKLYALWLEAIIETASDFDEQWNDAIGSSWRRILGHAIQHMIRKY